MVVDSRVLIVDDNVLVRQVLRCQLEAYGFEVDEACDGVQALECVEQRPYALILTDYRMPRLNGLSLLSHIQQQGKQIPVLLMSVDFIQEEEQLAKARGASSVLRKPIDGALLLRTIRTVIESPAASGTSHHPSGFACHS